MSSNRVQQRESECWGVVRSTEADVSLTKPSCGKMLYVLPYAVKMTKMQLNMCHPPRCIIPLCTQILLKTKRDKVF